MNQKRAGLAWDEFDTYLFDIDGTLIHCADAVHYFAFCEVLTAVAERPLNLDGVTAHGNTDTGIVRDALRRAGIPDAVWRSRLPEICERMCIQVERNEGSLRVECLPGVKELLRSLRGRGAHLGVATGNLERIGKRKLAAAGILDLIDFGGWSDSLEYRADVFARAKRLAVDAAGPSARILVVGDTPADVQAAKANQLPVIAVASGVYSLEQLRSEDADLCIQSLEELLAVS
ncbi:HAD family hydrolase [Acidobacteria bacterium AB60]|nr:HAD family hydrolase [Acidobacteria bacterium AB60]